MTAPIHRAVHYPDELTHLASLESSCVARARRVAAHLKEGLLRGKSEENSLVTVFEQEHFQGKCLEFMTAAWTTSAPSEWRVALESHSQCTCRSQYPKFKGQLFVVERGEYPNRVANAGSLSYHTERFMSIRPIYCAIISSKQPHDDFRERELHPSLQAVGWFMPEVGSMHVQSGAFVCYEYPGYRGQQYIMECERHGGDY
ncbi:crystallin, beta A1, like 2 [Xiphophorus hellerii]|uniref:crystallin, beta A1, like 2 n=1 Tax=Xiphophorus hellerii TaxID=8084 RepID=UPI0013B3B062|nr:beta-crystallin A1-like [Xiphophorus hellerii]